MQTLVEHLVHDHLQKGRLICPFPSVYRSGSSICLVMPTHRAAKPGAAQFRNWLLEQGADAALPFLSA